MFAITFAAFHLVCSTFAAATVGVRVVLAQRVEVRNMFVQCRAACHLAQATCVNHTVGVKVAAAPNVQKKEALNKKTTVL